MLDNIYFHQEGTEKLIAGVKKATSIIRGTYGAAGGNVVLEEAVYPFHSVRNDGKAIVEKIRLSDPVENIGANIIKEAGDKADKDSGDGRKTTMILTEAILDEAQKCDALPLDIKRSLDECVPIIMKQLDEAKKKITVDDIKSVATISSESESIGQKLQDIYKQIGAEGIVEVDHSNLPETYFEVTEGVRIRGAGFYGAYSTTEPDKAVYKKPKVLIAKDKITSANQLEALFMSLSKQGINELVIYCDEIDLSVLSMLAMTHLRGGFKTLVIKAPTLWKDWTFEDFAVITGATVVDEKNGKTFQSLTLADLGTCDKIITTKDETRVIGTKDVTEHVARLKAEGNDLRASWLQTKVAVLKVGASSESELSYVSKKAKDACHASYLALKDGVVAGGGLALYQCSVELAMKDSLGAKILAEALEAPIRQIMMNTGAGAGDIDTILLECEANQGLDANTGNLVNMFDAGIIDPVIVLKNAVRNAISIASTVLTLRGIITLPHENTPKM